MDKDKILKIINDDQQLGPLVAKAMEKAEKERDAKVVSEISAMSEEDFRKTLMQSKIAITPQEKTSRFSKGTYWRLAAACLLCALAIWSIKYLSFDSTQTSAYASMFQHYYTEYTYTQYDAKDDKLNANGKKSTAQMIQDASELLASKSRRHTQQAIDILQWLLNNEWRKTNLDPEIHWYLALAYLKDGQKNNAKSQLEAVIALNQGHSAEARQLLLKL